MKPVLLPEPGEPRNFDAIDPLDSRYYDPEVARYLSERSRIAYQAHVEAALARTLADFGVCDKAIAEQIVAAAGKITAEAAYEEEKITRHDIKAVVNCIKRDLPAAAQPYVHFGATSYDIISTATALQLRTATRELVLPRLGELQKTLLELTKKYAHTVQIGRTHGQHAVPITFGFAMAGYASRLGESMEAVRDLSGGLRGKFSGAVGASNALSLFVSDPVKFEKTLLGYLDLEPAPYSTQIVPAENIVRLLDELAITAGIMANLAHDMRHLQRTEIAEVRERFEKGQTGSSTMAHKRNPWNFENVISMSKQVTAQMVNANLNISSEHQRDLTDSASSRFYPVVLASVAAMAQRLNRVMGKLEVDEANMKRNLKLTGGAIAAEPLYLLLEKYGHTTAHEASKTVAHRALDNGQSLYEAAQADEALQPYLKKFTPEELKIIENPEEHYTGLAAEKALAVHTLWNKKLA
ncbi:MAG TPA: adenylosuccinate lyase [Candidatus Saccharimonadales bacterium]|nr:adenylosuccinate lyase [Candidatus Saccharimonadales bacterium]